MDGCVLKSDAGVIVYHNQEFWPINNYISASKKRAITRHTQIQDYGATNGVLIFST